MSLYSLISFVSHKKSSVHGYESLKIGLFVLHISPVEKILKSASWWSQRICL